MEKLVPQWSDKYSIGDSHIDAEHRRLFEIATQVEEAVYKYVTREELKDILSKLFNYMKEHFSNEEEYMQQINYTYLNEHMLMHKSIIHDMSHLIQNIKTTNDLKEKLYLIMSDWLLGHILQHDMMIGAWLKEQKEKQEEALKLDEFWQDDEKSLGAEVSSTTEPEKQISEPKFIYSCPCHTTHILSYKEHIEISCHKKSLRCKNCKKDIYYVKSQIDT